MELRLIESTCLLVNELGYLINYPKLVFSKDFIVKSCLPAKKEPFELPIQSKTLVNHELIKLINSLINLNVVLMINGCLHAKIQKNQCYEKKRLIIWAN